MLIFFEATVNGIVFLYSFFVCSLLVCRKASDFCKLILYLATFAEVFQLMSFDVGVETTNIQC
jgi:hypothetical protein